MYASIDILDWLVNIDESKAAQAMVKKSAREIGAVALGITSQVRIAALQYKDAMDKASSARESLSSSERLFQMLNERLEKGVEADLAVDEAKANVLNEKIFSALQ